MTTPTRPVTVGPFNLGVNTRLPDTQLDVPKVGTFLRSAVNVDISTPGTVKRRAGYSLALNATDAHSLYATENEAYFVDGTVLYRLSGIPAGLTKTSVRTGLRPGQKLSYDTLNQRVIYTDGSSVRRLDGLVDKIMGVPLMERSPMVTAISGGSLPAGRYQVCFAYVSTELEQSGTTQPVQVNVPENGTINISDLPITLPSGVTSIAVYMTQPNGDQLYFAQLLTPVAAAPSGVPTTPLALGTTLLYDSFTDPDGTPLSAHVSESGATYVPGFSESTAPLANLVLNSGQIQPLAPNIGATPNVSGVSIPRHASFFLDVFIGSEAQTTGFGQVSLNLSIGTFSVTVFSGGIDFSSNNVDASVSRVNGAHTLQIDITPTGYFYFWNGVKVLEELTIVAAGAPQTLGLGIRSQSTGTPGAVPIRLSSIRVTEPGAALPGLPVLNSTFIIPVLPTLTGRVQTLLMRPLPGGHIVRHNNGRLLVAKGKTLFYSEPFAPALHYPHKGFISFDSDITVVESLKTGTYVATNDAAYFFQGDIADAAAEKVLPYGAVPGTGGASPDRLKCWWMSVRGLVQATGQGVTNVQEQNVAVNPAAAGASMYREQNGLKQLVTSLFGTEASGASAYTFMQAEIIRKGTTL